MLTLEQLFEQDKIEPAWFWTHEVSTGPYSEYEVWDVVFVRDTHEPQKWVTDGDTRRTVYLTGICGIEADSRRKNGGTAQTPHAFSVLADLLDAARDVDDYPNLVDWAAHAQGISRDDQITAGRLFALTQDHRRAVACRNALQGWLGDDYDAYVKAAVQYLADN